MESVKAEVEKVVQGTAAPAVGAEESAPRAEGLPKKKSSMALRVNRNKLQEFKPAEPTETAPPAPQPSAAQPSAAQPVPEESEAPAQPLPRPKSVYPPAQQFDAGLMRSVHMYMQGISAASSMPSYYPFAQPPSGVPMGSTPYQYVPMAQPGFGAPQQEGYEQFPHYSAHAQFPAPGAYDQLPPAQYGGPPPGQYAQGHAAPQRPPHQNFQHSRQSRPVKSKTEGRLPTAGNPTYQRTPKGEADAPHRADFPPRNEPRMRKPTENANNFPELVPEREDPSALGTPHSAAESAPMTEWDQPEPVPPKPRPAAEAPKPKPQQPPKRQAEPKRGESEFQKKPSVPGPPGEERQARGQQESASKAQRREYRPRVGGPEREQPPGPELPAQPPAAAAQPEPKPPQVPGTSPPTREDRAAPAAATPPQAPPLVPEAPKTVALAPGPAPAAPGREPHKAPPTEPAAVPQPPKAPPSPAPKPASAPSAPPLSSQDRYDRIAEYVKGYVARSSKGMAELHRDFDQPDSRLRGQDSRQHLSARGSGILPPAPAAPAERPLISRLRLTEEDLRRLKEIKESADNWLAGKKDDDEEVKLYRHLKQTLNKLSPDNFELIAGEILAHCDKEQKVSVIVNFVVTKAWNEPVYTRWYAELVSRMIQHQMEWDFTAKRNAVKKQVLQLVEEKYTNGFEAYHLRVAELNADRALSPEDKQERMNKMRKVLLGNINFISELLQAKVIALTVIKWAVFYGMAKFLQEYGKAEEAGGTFSVKEDYLEALLKLFENCGQAVERKETAHRLKREKAGGRHPAPSDDAVLQRLGRLVRGDAANTGQVLEEIEASMATVQSIVGVFFAFMEMLKRAARPLSMRVESLIDNLREFRNSGWKTRVSRIEAARRSKKGEAETRRAAAQPVQAAVRVEQWEEAPRPAAAAPRDTREELRAHIAALHLAARKGLDTAAFRERYEQILFHCTDPRAACAVWLETIGADIRDLAAVEPRYEAGLRFAGEGLVTPEELYETFQVAYPQLALVYCDQTHLLTVLAELLYRLRRADLVELPRLRLVRRHPAVTDSDEAEDYAYFMQQLIEMLVQVFEAKPDGRLYAEELAAVKRGEES